jgi:hypothetical protein
MDDDRELSLFSFEENVPAYYRDFQNFRFSLAIPNFAPIF